MKNHENGNTRPTYFCVKNKDSKILWFIPMSSKIEKYRKLQKQKIERNGICNTIVIGNIEELKQHF